MRSFLLGLLLSGLLCACQSKPASPPDSPPVTPIEVSGSPISAKQAWEEISLLSAVLNQELGGVKAYEHLNETSADTSVFHKRFKINLAELRQFYKGQKNLIVYPVLTDLDQPLSLLLGTTGPADTLNAGYFKDIAPAQAQLYKENFRYQLLSTGLDSLLAPPAFFKNYFYYSLPTPIDRLEKWLSELFPTGSYPEYIYLSPGLLPRSTGGSYLTIIYSVPVVPEKDAASEDAYFNVIKNCPPPDICK